jgi:hypothetical protein
VTSCDSHTSKPIRIAHRLTNRIDKCFNVSRRDDPADPFFSHDARRLRERIAYEEDGSARCQRVVGPTRNGHATHAGGERDQHQVRGPVHVVGLRARDPVNDGHIAKLTPLDLVFQPGAASAVTDEEEVNEGIGPKSLDSVDDVLESIQRAEIPGELDDEASIEPELAGHLARGLVTRRDQVDIGPVRNDDHPLWIEASVVSQQGLPLITANRDYAGRSPEHAPPEFAKESSRQCGFPSHAGNDKRFRVEVVDKHHEAGAARYRSGRNGERKDRGSRNHQCHVTTAKTDKACQPDAQGHGELVEKTRSDAVPLERQGPDSANRDSMTSFP